MIKRTNLNNPNPNSFTKFILENVKKLKSQSSQLQCGQSLQSQSQFFFKYLSSRNDGNLLLFFNLICNNEEADGMKNYYPLANMLVSKPCIPNEDVKIYFDSVCLQLRDLLMYHDQKRGELAAARLAAYTTAVFLKRKPTLTKRLIINPLLDTLRCIYDADLALNVPIDHKQKQEQLSFTTDLHGNRILVNENVLEGSIRALTLLVSMDPLPFLMDQLESIFPHLLVLNLYSTSSKLLHVNEELSELVKLLLNLHAHPSSLLRTSFEKSVICSAGAACNGNYVGKFVPGSLGGVVVVARNASLSSESDDDHGGAEGNTTIIDPAALVAFIQKYDETDSATKVGGGGVGLAGDFFVEVVESHLRLRRNQASSNRAHGDDEDEEDEEDEHGETLLGADGKSLLLEKRQHQAMLEKYASDILVMYATLLLEMLEKFGDSLLQRTFQILLFVKVCLLDTDDWESINLGLTLLTFILDESVKEDVDGKEEPIHFNANEISVLKEIKIVLSTLSQCEEDSISSLASLARLKLAATVSSASSSSSNTKSPKSNNDGLSASSLSIFQSAIKDLADELVPIRASGISKLTGLVLSKDKVATMHIDSLSTIFLDLLSDEDSFIYLNAVKACSALTESYSAHAMQPLTIRYKNETLSSAYRSRIGEVLLRTVQRLGKAITFPHHATILVTSVFVVMRSPDPDLQSSALVLLSQIARQGCVLLESCLYQVLDYINHVFSRHVRPTPGVTRESLQVLKGTLVLVYELLLGFGVDLVDRGLVGGEELERIRWAVGEIAGGASGDVVCQGHAERIQALFQKLLL